LRIPSQIETSENDDTVQLFQIEEPERKPAQRGPAYRRFYELIEAGCIGDVPLDTCNLIEEDTAQSAPVPFILQGSFNYFAAGRETVYDR
jgi:hypothetical protein